jgi:hypothetical protein
MLSMPALAGPKDADGLIAVAEAMNEFMEGKYDEGLGRLDDALKDCKGKACDASVRAQIHMAAGILWAAGRKNIDEARAAFERALKEDPDVTLDRQWATKEVEKAFALARAGDKPPPPAAGKKAWPGKEQLDAVAAAEAQLAQKDWSGCMQTLVAAMAAREFAAGKLTLARCEDAGNLLLEASSDATAAAKLAEGEANPKLVQAANELSEKIASETPTLSLVIPKAMSEVEAKVDGEIIPKDRLDKPIPRNPGKATVEVKAKRGRFPVTFRTTEAMDRGEQITVNVEGDSSQNNSAVLQCILSARTPQDVQLCIETGGKGRGLTVKAGGEIAAYADDDHTDVLTPSIYVSADNPTAGWQVGGSFLVDVVSTASADIVATASRRFDEVRYAGTLAGDYKIGVTRVGLSGALSSEPDYLATSFGAAVSADLFEKMVTPSLAYTLSLDTLGKHDTSFDDYSKDITRHTIDGGVSLVVDASTVAAVGTTLELVAGDTSKPYRTVPIFPEGVADRVPSGASPDLVRDYRTASMLERLPDGRTRLALFGRVARRFESSTLRADERLYVDSWGQKASTTDARFLVDLDERLRVGPHLRFNVQGPVDFWRRAYFRDRSGGLPEYRTTDRELGPLMALTLGGTLRYALTESLAGQVQIDGIYTTFLDHLYIQDRWALFTATMLELEID